MTNLIVIVQIAGRRCALEAHAVKSVLELGQITPVPRSPAHIRGITALRSQALTVVDCRLALGLDPEPCPTDSRAAVICVDGHSYALVLDAIEDIASRLSEPKQVPGGFGPEWSRIASGMIETAIGAALLIDLPTLIGARADNWGDNRSAA
jgi:purine-binding chemotaxis protein CheW